MDFRKPIIPEGAKDILYSAGIDEANASEVIVDSHIERFNEAVEKATNEPEKKQQLKEVRRKGKNRFSAKKSRQNKLDHMEDLRKTHRRLTVELATIKSAAKKCQVNMVTNV